MAISKGWEVGSTIYCHYQDEISDYFTPVERIVSSVKFTSDGNVSIVSFESGRDVVDTDALQTVFTTQALCAAAIIDRVIAASTATVLLDTGTLSGASTAGNVATTLVRKG